MHFQTDLWLVKRAACPIKQRNPRKHLT